jgi:peptide deformylase
MKILTAPHPMLSRRCRSDFIVLVADIGRMASLLRVKGGAGLAAPQVEIDARMFVTSWGQVFVNPRIVAACTEYKAIEGCLSIPGQLYKVRRYKYITLSTGEQFADFRAEVIQHEIDHLDGILISHHGHLLDKEQHVQADDR